VLNKVHLSAFGLLSLRLLVTHILEHQWAISDLRLYWS
jgi:hypothetical protein